MNIIRKFGIFAAAIITSSALFISAAKPINSSISKNQHRWNKIELKVINNTKSTFNVLNVNNKKELQILRNESSELSPEMIRSNTYQRLCEKMLATVTSPEQDGVGLAGPQIGISRRVVAVQRFDKNGAPFEVYPNIRITNKKGKRVSGPEGCLSIPGVKGEVERYQNIDITYTSTATLCDTTEQIKGFTAVIFQHECDHLDGILYTDYKNDNIINDMKIILDIENGTERRITAIPEDVCSRQIDIVLDGKTIKSVVYTGGCDGNLKGIGSLIKGMTVEEAINRLDGITCGRKTTSCPDQLAKALQAISK